MRITITLFLSILLFGTLNAQSTSTYEITVVTPKMANAGTGARVFLKINGASRNSTALHLDNQYNNHEQGDVDVYSYELPDVGNIESIVLYHDNTGKKPGWFCESVTILNTRTGEEWYFNVNKWFATSAGDGKIRRRIYPTKL
ncbi:PLAT/LH2 domain-containing protein [Phaeodactylibacter xiamenensis]|uniref:PLAT/LH2 domain-containing protein n=1 Tax=Phaeodactylibacter xiamenensis TaxID=1524460 RepID=UPI003BA87291